MNTPVLLIAFKRPRETAAVLDAIRRARPARLFVACDGPRADRPGEATAVAETRAVIDEGVDWPCVVTRLYQQENLGCRRGVKAAIDWFFEHVPAGIIIEDDVVPLDSFWRYAEELLARYAEDERIWAICALNHSGMRVPSGFSYTFSRYNHVWGWATWRRAWQKYDAELSQWPSFREHHGLARIGGNDRGFERYWTQILDKCHRGLIDTWDYQWAFSMWAGGGLAILPSISLATNIGFGDAATHTTKVITTERTGEMSFPLVHPPTIGRNVSLDRSTHRRLFVPPLWVRALNRVRRLGTYLS